MRQIYPFGISQDTLFQLRLNEMELIHPDPLFEVSTQNTYSITTEEGLTVHLEQDELDKIGGVFNAIKLNSSMQIGFKPLIYCIWYRLNNNPQATYLFTHEEFDEVFTTAWYLGIGKLVNFLFPEIVSRNRFALAHRLHMWHACTGILLREGADVCWPETACGLPTPELPHLDMSLYNVYADSQWMMPFFS